MKNSPPEWDRIEIGTKLGELVKTPDSRQIFMFSAITWNRHAIHYDRQRALSEGLPDIVVQRALIGNFFAQFLEQWIEANGDILRLEWKVVRSALPGDTLTCRGAVRKKHMEGEKKLVTCVIEMTNQKSEYIASGEATLIFDL
jgi:hydroxyacyl-ACP dehydratase HTD2-like protein with hotdog domain